MKQNQTQYDALRLHSYPASITAYDYYDYELTN